MTTGEMSIIEHAETAKLFLQQSDAEFAIGDKLQASEKLYGAANHVLTAIAQQRGWKYNSHRDMKNVTQRLEQEYGEPFMVGGFVAAEKFHRNFIHGGMEDYEVAVDRPNVHRYIERMLEVVEEYSLRG